MADYKYTESHFENAVLELFEKFRTTFPPINILFL